MFKMLLGVKASSNRDRTTVEPPVTTGLISTPVKPMVPMVATTATIQAIPTNTNVTPISQKQPHRNSLIFCERETDIISDDVIYGSDDDYDDNYNKSDSNLKDIEDTMDVVGEGANKYWNHRLTSSGAGIAPMDDPLLCEDILSCISALDDVIAEFDDPSLPYINEEDPILSSSVGETFQTSPYESDKLVSIKESGTNRNYAEHHQVQLSDFQPPVQLQQKQKEEFNGCNKSPSQLIHVPVSSTSSSSKPTKSSQKTPSGSSPGEKSISPSCSTSSSISGKFLATSSSSSRGSVGSRTSSVKAEDNIIIPSSSRPSHGNTKASSTASVATNAKAVVAGGTYSKGSNYEIILPRISSDKSSSSRNITEEPIYSSIGKSRPQISLGLYSSPDQGGVTGSTERVKVQPQVYPPNEPEVDYNEENEDEFYNYTKEGGLKTSKSSSSALGHSKEEWNFPSEKNLPRSLRKTRKTCFLDDQSDEKSEGRVNNELDLNDSNGEGAGGMGLLNGCVVVNGGHSSPSQSQGGSIIKCYEEINQNNGKTVSRNDSRKIYEDIVAISSSQQNHNAKTNNPHRHHRNNNSCSNAKEEQLLEQKGLSPSSTTSSISFTISSAMDQPIPKPRVRQQIPVSDQSNQSPPSHVKYPPGKIPKPNPKPCGSRPESGRGSSPSSPVQCEISRTEEEGGPNRIHIGVNKKLRTGAKGLDNGIDEALLQSDGINESGVKSLNSKTSPNNGNMMRIMRIMKPSAKNNSTGSASSISRSSSSSSGGDPNYYRKEGQDNLSSSSGVVVTTNSSTTSASPTHSVTNNNNNSITVINSSGKVKGQSILEVKRRQGGHQNMLQSAQNKPTVVPGSGVLDVDDGYLSMINRNEAPLLWPEEFIENETFSPDELKRLSVHLPEETSPSDSDSCSEGKDLELEIVDYDREPSRRLPNHHNNRSLKSPSAPINRRNPHSKEKADYFSDDSLEGESEEHEMSFHKARGTSVSPYLSAGGMAYTPITHGSNPHMASFISANSPKPYNHQKITVNNVTMQQANSQASRIPKMVTGNQGKKHERSSTGSTASSSSNSKPLFSNQVQPVVMRKPCSFFISLTDAPEVIASGKSSSLPKGSKVAISPTKKAENSIKDKLTKAGVGEQAETSITSTSGNSSNPSTNGTKQFTSQLPKLRHTKSINTGGPRTRSTNNINANKRKSTSDLVTVLGLNQDLQGSQQSEVLSEKFETPEGALPEERVVVTSSFNRTTFLIPSPCSRTMDESPRKRQRDDETDNDEDDFSSDFDLLSSTDLDSLQPLTIHNVQDFVSEIMDTAIRHGLKRVHKSINPIIDKPLTTTTSNTTTLLIHDGYNFEDLKSEKKSEEPCSVEPCEIQVSGLKTQKDRDEASLEITAHSQEDTLTCDDKDNSGNFKTSSRQEEVRRDHEDIVSQRSETVSQQLDDVVTTFLSDNECFLAKGNVDNESDLLTRDQYDQAASSKDQNLQEKDAIEESQGSSKSKKAQELEKLESPVEEPSSGLMVTVLSLSTDDNLTEVEKPVLNSASINNNNSNNNAALRDSSLLGEDKILDESTGEEDSEELPPEFIPTPPPQLMSPMTQIVSPLAASLKNLIPSESRNHRFGNGNLHHSHQHHHHHHNNVSNVRDGKATLDLLAQRITNSKKCSSPEDDLQVSQFINDKRNIWALYDRPFDEDLLTVNSTGRGYASRSQENLMDAMCKERFTKSFSSRGQSSTLPLNCRPPASQRRSTTFRNMFNKFRRNKQPETVIREIPEYRDDEVQSITSRETGPSEQGKKRGFFSRLFRRSRKN